MTRRVFLTGFGPVCSTGREAGTLWENLLAGRSFIGPVARLEGAPVAFGSEVDDAGFEDLFDPREMRYDRVTRLAIAAARLALGDAGLSRESIANPEAAGVIVGSSRGAAEILEAAHRDFLGGGEVGPRVSPLTTPGNLSGAVARHLGFRGPTLSVSAACSSGSQAIGLGVELVRHGRAELVVAGGSEACLTPFCIAMFASTGILSRWPGDPRTASRPFDRDRSGLVLGEGAGMVVLESEARARARGARVLAEVRGFGSTCDAYSLTAVPHDGEGLARAIRKALEDARIAPEEIGYVNAHGSSTKTGDLAEIAALKTAFGPHARSLAVSSTKSMTGHLIGATGAIEAGICALALGAGKVPPTINLEHPDPRCDLDCVPLKARDLRTRAVLSNTMGFGGNNAVLVFSAV